MANGGMISRPVELSLRLIGVWPGASHRIPRRIVWMVSLVASQTFQFWYLVDHIAVDDLPEFLDCFSVTLTNGLLLFKLVILWLKARTVHDILAIITEDWDECAPIGWTAAEISGKAAWSGRLTMCIICAYVSTCTLYTFGGLVVDERYRRRELLLRMELPFDPTSSPVYEVVILLQFLFQMLAALTAGMLMALMIALIVHVGGQIDLICGRFAKIADKTTDGHEFGASWIGRLVKKHQRVVLLSEKIESVFSYMSLMQFLSNTVVICFLAFVIVSSLDGPDSSTVILKYLPYYVIINMEAFVLCYSGEYLSSKSATIGLAAYDCIWYDMSQDEIKVLLVLILRSQRRLTLTIGKFMDLSLESFAAMLKASASYVSVLHAMY